jgi:hypothetical protein
MGTGQETSTLDRGNLSINGAMWPDDIPCIGLERCHLGNTAVGNQIGFVTTINLCGGITGAPNTQEIT